MAIVFATLLLEAQALNRRDGEPSNHGIRRYVVGEIAEDLTAGQTLTPRADGLSSITIHPRAVSGHPTGIATLELRDITAEAPVVVQRAEVQAAELVGAGAYTLRFPPQPSLGRRYELELRVTGAPRGNGIGLLATRGDGYPDGSLRVRGRTRFGDLVFESSVDDARSNFAVLAARLAENGVPAPALLLALAVLLQNVALFFILTAVTEFHPDE